MSTCQYNKVALSRSEGRDKGEGKGTGSGRGLGDKEGGGFRVTIVLLHISDSYS